jgi:NAD(P)-dependent dehydrogenase (short-subunit alcohol dehydrogenase family)
MQIELNQQPVIVVGASGGIGTAICEAFADAGAVLGLVDRNPQVVEQARRLQEAYGTTTAAAVVDATDTAALRGATARLINQLGSFRHAVVAVGAGSGRFGMPFWNLEPHDWEPVLRVNVMACVNTAHTLVPSMLDHRDGSLCFLSSVAAQVGSSTDPPYSAAKAAVLNFTHCAARDLAPYGIRVNAICPGMVKTALNESVWRAWADRVPPAQRRGYEEWAAEKIARVTPLGRWQETSEIAAVAVFLASQFGRNITGQTINVDGGQVMHC